MSHPQLQKKTYKNPKSENQPKYIHPTQRKKKQHNYKYPIEMIEAKPNETIFHRTQTEQNKTKQMKGKHEKKTELQTIYQNTKLLT